MTSREWKSAEKPFANALSLIIGLTLTLAAVSTTGATEWLPGDDDIGIAAGDQRDPSIAQGGDLLLVVWADERLRPTGALSNEYETSSDIYGQRFDTDGNPLDTVPFVITQQAAAQTKPQLAWNGTHWLVAFESVTSTEFFYTPSLEVVRVAPTGEIVDSQSIQVHGVAPSGSAWSLASDGANWVVAFQSKGLEALRITSEGIVEQPPTQLVAETHFLRSGLRLAFADGIYLFTWMDSAETLALRFDAALQILDAEPFTLVDAAGLSSLASNNLQFYAAWTQQRPDFSTAVFGSRVDVSGVKLDGLGVDISGQFSPQPFTTTSVAWDGTDWKATWQTDEVVRLARIDADGQVLDPGGIPVPGPQSGLTAATSTGGLEIVWSDFQNNEYDVFGAHIPGMGPARENLTLSTGGPQQARSDVAVGSDGYMIVYRSDVDHSTRIEAMPLDADGLPLLTEPLELDAGTALAGPGTPSVAWNGSLYLATWGNENGIVARRLMQDGTLVDPVPFAVMPGFGATDVSSLGGDFLVMGRQFGFNIQVILPVAARVLGDGTVLDPDGMVVGANYVHSVAVTTLGDRWLAVWHRTFSHDDPLGENMAAFVDANGTITADFQVFQVYSKSGGNGIFTLTAAAGEETALIVQSAELSSGVETDLAGVIVHANGAVDPFFNMTPWAGNQYRAKAAWDGNQFVVVYNEQKNRFAKFTLDQLDATSDLFGMRIGANGTIVDPQGFAFSLSKTAEAYPSIAAGHGISLIAGSILRNEAPFAAYRVGYDRFGVSGNRWPVAVASGSGGGVVPVNVQFDSIGSTDPDGSITSYLWDFGDGDTSTLPSPGHTYTIPGDYVATLTVFDDGGAQTTDTIPVEADTPNIPPVAIAAADSTSGAAPLSVVFNADGSFDVDGSLGNILWEFDDGTIYWGSPAFKTFTEPGEHPVTLTIWDDDGATGTDSLTIEVTGTCDADCLRATDILLRPANRGDSLGVMGGVRVADESGAFLADAIVNVQWSRPDGSILDQSGTTNAGGIARFGTRGGAGTYTLTINGISKAGYQFDPDNSVLSESIVR